MRSWTAATRPGSFLRNRSPGPLPDEWSLPRASRSVSGTDLLPLPGIRLRSIDSAGTVGTHAGCPERVQIESTEGSPGARSGARGLEGSQWLSGSSSTCGLAGSRWIARFVRPGTGESTGKPAGRSGRVTRCGDRRGYRCGACRSRRPRRRRITRPFGRGHAGKSFRQRADAHTLRLARLSPACRHALRRSLLPRRGVREPAAGMGGDPEIVEAGRWKPRNLVLLIRSSTS